MNQAQSMTAEYKTVDWTSKFERGDSLELRLILSLYKSGPKLSYIGFLPHLSRSLIGALRHQNEIRRYLDREGEKIKYMKFHFDS